MQSTQGLPVTTMFRPSFVMTEIVSAKVVKAFVNVNIDNLI